MLSPPPEQGSPLEERALTPPPRTPKRVDSVKCRLLHKHKQQSQPVPPPVGGVRLPSRTPTYRRQDGGQQVCPPQVASHTKGNSRVEECPTPQGDWFQSQSPVSR
ncbi:hypothetical protein AMECASPLE_025881 [Ameca splendens]|uniref:Uncharacterized protein n=1 Tax=Ameca splendens TaxID=208324 RepID=A0ABV1AB41_9TELE